VQPTGDHFHVEPDYQEAFARLGLTSMEAVFRFDRGDDLTKANLARYRRRLRFQVGPPGRILFMKLYHVPPVRTQLQNWINGHKRRSCAMMELEPMAELAHHGINTPRPVAYGQIWKGLLEQRSFLVTEKIPDAESLENRLPPCFDLIRTPDAHKQQRAFLTQLAQFIRRFHDLGYRHRDLYLAHIFRDTQGQLFLIDLARAFKPLVCKRRFLIKDLAQVYYSLPAPYFSRTDRLRLYLSYMGKHHLDAGDKHLIHPILAKARRMARHNLKHGRPVPYLTYRRAHVKADRPMRVAIIAERIDTALGGAERSVGELCDALSAQGMDVTLLAAKGDSASRHVHILCRNRLGKRVDPRAFGTALQKHLQLVSCDIVHSVLPFPFADVYQPRGGTYAETILRNAASYEHGLVPTAKRLTAFANQRRQAWMRAERALAAGTRGPVIAALSRYVAEQFQRHYHTPPERIVLINNGVHTRNRPAPDSADPLRLRILNHLGLTPDDKPVFYVFAAHNFRLKGLGPLIRAFAEVTRSDPHSPCRLVVVGNGDQRGYEQRARRLRAERYMVFLGGVDDLAAVLALTDVAVLPTFYDPASRFILEALGAGIPVITTRFNGAGDLFTHARHGIILDDPTDVPGLAQAVRDLSDSARRTAMCHAIRQDGIIDNVSIDRVATELKALYASIRKRRG